MPAGRRPCQQYPRLRRYQIYLHTPPGDGGGTQTGEGPADGGTRRPVGGGGGLTGKRQRERVGEAAKEAAPLVQCVLGEVRVGKGMVKGQVVIRLAEVVACRRRKQAKRVGKERRAVTSVDGVLVTTFGVVTSDGQDFEDSSNRQHYSRDG